MIQQYSSILVACAYLPTFTPRANALGHHHDAGDAATAAAMLCACAMVGRRLRLCLRARASMKNDVSPADAAAAAARIRADILRSKHMRAQI